MDDDRKDEDAGNRYFPEGTPHMDVFFRLGDLHFIWDKAKSDKCYAERGFDFRTAAMVFYDDLCINEPDPNHSVEERRFYLVGKPTSLSNSPEAYIGQVNDVLYVVYAEDDKRWPGMLRIVSARRATKKENKLYDDYRAIFLGLM